MLKEERDRELQDEERALSQVQDYPFCALCNAQVESLRESGSMEFKKKVICGVCCDELEEWFEELHPSSEKTSGVFE